MVDTYLESTLESVDGADEMVLKAAEEAGLPEEELHNISIAVRETMVNAVVHGNRYNAHKRVHLEIARAADHLAIIVAD